MSEWITNRIPLVSDATKRKGLVWICVDGKIPHEEYYDEVFLGQPWMPITTPEPYVKPKRAIVFPNTDGSGNYWVSMDTVGPVAFGIPTHEAANRIAAIYEEVMP